MAKKMALGKGIASLLKDAAPSASVIKETYESHFGPQENNKKSESEIEIRYEHAPLLVAVGAIKTNPGQPRKIFKEKELEELGESIKENGIIQPLVVCELEGAPGHYELVAGERRLRAAKKIGLEQVPVIVKRGTDREKMIMSIIENVQRSDLNCVEEALAYYQLMNEYKLSQEEVAKKLGKERSTVANFLRILSLPRPVIDLLQKEMISFGHAKVLVSLKEREEMIRFANECVARSWSVRELEAAIRAHRPKKENEFKKNPFFDEKLNVFKKTLENKTGYHFAINSGKNGSGQIAIKFNNEAEFNDIYEYLLSK